jgi:hypothetical protein
MTERQRALTTEFAYRSPRLPLAIKSLSVNKNDRRLDLDEERLIREARHPDPSCARRILAEGRLESSGDGAALMHMTLPDIEPKCTDVA